MKELKMKKLNTVICGTILGLASINAIAQNSAIAKDASLVTTNMTDPSTQLVEKVFVPGRLIQIGTVSDNLIHRKILKGFANELPLITVMKQITPNGWIVKKNDSEDSPLDVQKSISWQGGKNWIETLEIIAKDYNLNYLVNWDDKVITISNSEKIVPKLAKVEIVEQKKSIFELASIEVAEETNKKKDGNTTDMTVGASEVAVEESKGIEIAVEPVQIAWDLLSSKTLKQNVIAWGEKAGYRVVWTGEDYPVVDTRILAGDFDAENGPIKQLSIDYGPESRAQNPLSFQFYQNKTLVVENMAFEQGGYSQYSKK